MAEYPKFVYIGGQGEIVEKKSRFLADVSPVETEEDVAAFLEQIRKKYWDAGHHCSAFVLGARGEITRCSDDGEPSGTAGRPILDVLTGSGVQNACIVVTRYFGGVLLGTGGLVRAYGRAARAGLDASILLDRIPGRKLKITCDYNSIGRIQYMAGSRGYRTLSESYGEGVTLTYLIPDAEAAQFSAGLTEATNGKAVIEDRGFQEYAELEKEFILL